MRTELAPEEDGLTAELTPTSAATDQPVHRRLGLTDAEYEHILEILGRDPSPAELAMYSVMWSEHCSYKSSKVHLRYFGETTTEQMRTHMLAGIGENGLIQRGGAYRITPSP